MTVSVQRTDRVAVDGAELAYVIRGAGEPVVLLHNGAGLDWFSVLFDEPALSNHQLVTYHRIGYGASSRPAAPVGFWEEAAHCVGLMRSIGIERAHLVGHSSSAMIALQVAADSPDSVKTLSLLESARPAPATPTQQEFVRDFVRPALASYAAGDKAAAVDIWMTGVCGPDYGRVLDRALPDARDQALAAADMYFGHEVPAVQQWSFTEEDAKRIRHPALLVLGEKSKPIFRERRELLLEWLPNPEPFDLADATHLLHVENPRGMAEGLAAFFS
jgi:pimeloyl-ACP methyl ester carboxylesterase